MNTKLFNDKSEPSVFWKKPLVQLIIHPSKFMDTPLYAKTEIKNIYYQLEKNNSFEIPEYLDFPTYQKNPGSYLRKLLIPAITSIQEENLSKTIFNSSSEIILSGGCFEVCHLAWFKKLLFSRLENSSGITFHFFQNAIYPENKSFSQEAILKNHYFKLIESPYNFFINKSNASKENLDSWSFPYKETIPGTIYLDNSLIWQNSTKPLANLYYWSSFKLAR